MSSAKNHITPLVRKTKRELQPEYMVLQNFLGEKKIIATGCTHHYTYCLALLGVWQELLQNNAQPNSHQTSIKGSV